MIISRPVEAVLAVVLLVALVAGGTIFAIWQSTERIGQSQRDWCATMELLTSKPVPKSAGASYRLYEDFLQLEHTYGCSG